MSIDLPWIAIGAAAGIGVALAVLTLGFLLRNRHLTRQLNELKRSGQRAPATGPAATMWQEGAAPIDIPVGLIDLLANGRAVLFAGSHIGDFAGEINFGDLLTKLLIDANVGEKALLTLQRAIQQGDYDFAADAVRNKLSDADLRERIDAAYKPDSGARIHAWLDGVGDDFYKVLSKIPFAAVLTTTWSEKLDQEFVARRPVVFSPGSEQLGRVIRSDDFFVLHLWGRVRRTSELLFTRQERMHAIKQSPIYGKFINSLIKSKGIVFIGTPPLEIEAFLRLCDAPSRQQHYAILPHSTMHGRTRLVTAKLQDKLGVNVINFDDSNGEFELLHSLRDIVEQIESRRPPVPAQDTSHHLSALRLVNIGPFRELSVDFRRDGMSSWETTPAASRPSCVRSHSGSAAMQHRRPSPAPGYCVHPSPKARSSWTSATN